MTRLDLSVPDDVKALADERVAEGGYASLSAYVAELIRRDQRERDELRHTEAILLQRLPAGASQPMTDADFDQIRNRLEGEITQRRRP